MFSLFSNGNPSCSRFLSSEILSNERSKATLLTIRRSDQPINDVDRWFANRRGVDRRVDGCSAGLARKLGTNQQAVTL